MSIPKELKAVKQWIVWKENKKPHSAITMKSTGWQKEENWTTFADAKRVMKECNFLGIGFVFKFPFVGIDLDNCIEEDGMMNELAGKITNSIDTFTEYSKSGKGLHLYCKVTEPIEALKTDIIEIYGEGRFFVVTGKELDSEQLEITDQTTAIKELILKYRPVVSRATGIATPTQFIEGERNNRMAGEIGRMFNYWNKDTVFNMAHTLNQSICFPPLEDKELNAIIDSMGKRETKQIPPKQMEQVNWEHIQGKRDLDSAPYRGISKIPGSYISTGIGSLDYAMNDLAPGCVTLLSGRMNGGKSTFVKQIIANAINTNNKVFAISGEGDQELSINSLYECVIGRESKFYDVVQINKRLHKEPKQFVLDALQKWHKGKLTLFDKGQSSFTTTKELFTMIDLEVKENHSNLIIIDNLMSILKSSAIEKNEAQADFMQQCHNLAGIHKIHIILVLHTNKEYRKGMTMEVEHISGTSDLGNKADNVISVIREYDEEKKRLGISGQITLTKNRYYPELMECDTRYEVETGLLLELKNNDPIAYDFDWMKYLDPSQIPAKEFWEE